MSMARPLLLKTRQTLIITNSMKTCYSRDHLSPAPNPCQVNSQSPESTTLTMTCPISQAIKCRAETQACSTEASSRTTSLRMRFRTFVPSLRCLIQIVLERLKSKTSKRLWEVCNVTPLRLESLWISSTLTQTAEFPSKSSSTSCSRSKIKLSRMAVATLT